MKRFTLQNENTKPCVMALGFFDGVHLGHCAVIEKAVEKAQECGISSAVFTFTADKNIINKTKNGEIYDIEKRLSLIEEIGVDFALVPDFSDFRGLSPRDFVLKLTNQFSASAFTCGADFRFGEHASGDVKLLKALGEELGFEVFVVDAVDIGGERVSSSAIREALSQGNLDKAATMLGRPFEIEGEVISGEHIGSKRLYPTINLALPQNFALKRGVYASRASVDGIDMPAVTNIGVCPTVKKDASLVAETYILDTTLDLYGKKVRISLNKFLRDEIKFQSEEKLKEQISRDIENAKNIM